MYRCFATVLLVLSAVSFTGCDSGGDIVPDEGGTPTMTAADRASEDAYQKEQLENQKKTQRPE